MTELNQYTVYIKLTVWGDSPADAVDYVENAIDASDLLSQDGIIGIEVIDDDDSIELLEEYDDNPEEGDDY